MDSPSAFMLILSGDRALYDIVGFSLKIASLSVLVSAILGLPLGAALALSQFRGRQALIILTNGMMGLPPVVAGLLVFLLLSRAGPLGNFGLLFSPTAMVMAQSLLITPIIAALTRQIIDSLWQEYRDELTALRVPLFGRISTLLWDARYGLITVLLAGFGRAISEVGAIMIVGGNIEGFTRTMTTAISLETSKGNLPFAVSLGLLLMLIVFIINLLAWCIREYGASALGER